MEDAFEAALRAHAMGKPVAAMQICRAILIAEPEHIGALNLLAALSLRDADAETAGDLAERVLAFVPDDPDALETLCGARLKQRRYAEAIEAARHAVDLDPTVSDAHVRLARGLRCAEQHDAALASYARAIRCRPVGDSAFLEYATFLVAIGRDDEAVDILDEAVQAFPDAVRLWWLLADRLRAQGRREAALGAYRRGVACRPRVFGVHFDYATLLLELGREERALAEAREALAIEPDHPMAARLIHTITLIAGADPAHAH